MKLNFFQFSMFQPFQPFQSCLTAITCKRKRNCCNQWRYWVKTKIKDERTINLWGAEVCIYKKIVQAEVCATNGTVACATEAVTWTRTNEKFFLLQTLYLTLILLSQISTLLYLDHGFSRWYLHRLRSFGLHRAYTRFWKHLLPTIRSWHHWQRQNPSAKPAKGKQGAMVSYPWCKGLWACEEQASPADILLQVLH